MKANGIEGMGGNGDVKALPLKSFQTVGCKEEL